MPELSRCLRTTPGPYAVVTSSPDTNTGVVLATGAGAAEASGVAAEREAPSRRRSSAHCCDNTTMRRFIWEGGQGAATGQIQHMDGTTHVRRGTGAVWCVVCGVWCVVCDVRARNVGTCERDRGWSAEIPAL